MVQASLASLLILLSFPLDGQCMLEELKAGLGGAKAYLDSLLPIINDGIKAVQVDFKKLLKADLSKHLQRFEEFVDNTIEEDCFFQCPRGKQMKVW